MQMTELDTIAGFALEYATDDSMGHIFNVTIVRSKYNAGSSACI